MVQLLADPAAFDGRVVRVMGFCHLEFEGNALYLHREDVVQATVDSQEHGHHGLFSAVLRDITSAEPSLSRADFQKLGPPPPPPRVRKD